MRRDPVFTALTNMRPNLLSYILLFLTSTVSPLWSTAEEIEIAADNTQQTPQPSPTPVIVRAYAGERSEGYKDSLQIVNIGKRQQYSSYESATFDTDINSPKSAIFSPDGKYIYINSLEGCRTVKYEAATLTKAGVIRYNFPSGKGKLWAAPSEYYTFTHYPEGRSRSFSGKPVEMAWSHGGRYLWIPFYRRTFDLNAQDPSAIAVIDVETDSIVRMFDTGPLAKMVAVSPDSKTVAITHWGDNTIGLINISSDRMDEWHHLAPLTIGSKLNLNYSLTTPVNRDSNSGYALRGTIFTPDGKWLLVSGMGGPLSIIDVEKQKVIGSTNEAYAIRHLATDGKYVYGSCNSSGMIIRFELDSLINSAIEKTQYAGKLRLGKIDRYKIGKSARTIELSPDNKYLFIADNLGNQVIVVKTQTMQVIDRIKADSYPVGLALSPDGRFMAVTSQGLKGGGNAVNFYEIVRNDYPASTHADTASSASPIPTTSDVLHFPETETAATESILMNTIGSTTFYLILSVAILSLFFLIRFSFRKK